VAGSGVRQGREKIHSQTQFSELFIEHQKKKETKNHGAHLDTKIVIDFRVRKTHDDSKGGGGAQFMVGW
jgi:hypothetical protein